MERRPSRVGAPFGWGAYCLTTLLAASILSSCFLLAEGQPITLPVQIQLQPPHPAEGQNLTLTPTPRDNVEKALLCRWYRGLTTDSNQLIYTYYISINSGRPGVASTGRETAGPDCSLYIRNVTSGDTGNLTVKLDGPDINTVEVHASVVVSASNLSSCFLLAEGQPITIQVQIQLQPPHPAEGQNLTLTPTPRDNVEKAYNCRWYRGLTTDPKQLIYIYYISIHNGKPDVASTGRETVGPDCSLRIRNVSSGDTGNFTLQLDGLNINSVEVHASVVVSGSR